MPEASFYFNSTYNKCSIDPTEVNSVGGPENPKLQVWIALEMDPGQGKQCQPFILLSVDAKLRVFDSSFDISSGTSIQYCKVFSKSSNRIMIEFVLSSYKIMKIEERRIDNLKASLDLTFRALNFETISLPTGNSKKELNVLTDLSSAYCNINFEIPHSQWISKHLPALGWASSTLIELPCANELIPKEYSQSLAELSKANEYFTNGDYDKVVAHCRSAIEPIKEKLPSLKNNIESRHEFDWIKKINESTFNWLDIVIKGTSSFSSKAHHAPSIGHFSRHDAQVVQLITTAIIAFAGKCISVHSSID
jgi:hypothetical protein